MGKTKYWIIEMFIKSDCYACIAYFTGIQIHNSYSLLFHVIKMIVLLLLIRPCVNDAIVNYILHINNMCLAQMAFDTIPCYKILYFLFFFDEYRKHFLYYLQLIYWQNKEKNGEWQKNRKTNKRRRKNPTAYFYSIKKKEKKNIFIIRQKKITHFAMDLKMFYVFNRSCSESKNGV